MSALPTDLMTAKEASEYLNLAIRTIYKYGVYGKLNRVNDGCHGVPAVYCRSEVESLRLKLKRHQRILNLSHSHRTCTKCRQSLTIEQFGFYTNHSGNIARKSRCVSCCTKTLADYRDKNRKRMTDYYADYGLFYRTVTGAIADGKTSPICRSVGFTLAVRENGGIGTIRAARLDKPLSPGESALVQYEFHYGAWCVLPVPVRAGDSDRIMEWCQRYEARQRAKKNKKGESR